MEIESWRHKTREKIQSKQTNQSEKRGNEETGGKSEEVEAGPLRWKDEQKEKKTREFVRSSKVESREEVRGRAQKQTKHARKQRESQWDKAKTVLQRSWGCGWDLLSISSPEWRLFARVCARLSSVFSRLQPPRCLIFSLRGMLIIVGKGTAT